MEIIALSDQHIDKSKSVHEHRSNEVNGIITSSQNNVDNVLIIGGDIAKTKNSLNEGLGLFSGFKGKKLAYLGNHELEAIEKTDLSGDYIGELNEIYNGNGFHLLDNSPVIINGVGFVGNSGFFDETLYKGDEFEEVKRKEIGCYNERYKAGGLTPAEFNDICIDRIKRHIRGVSSYCERIVLGIHHIGFEDFVLYGKSDEFDQYNYGMGSTKLGDLYGYDEKIALGLCGHTHRSSELIKHGRRIVNVSSGVHVFNL